MKKNYSLIMMLFLTLVLLCPVKNINNLSYAESSAIIHSGTIQDTDIHYTLDENGVLTVSGTGVIPDDYEGHELEWKQWKNDIVALVVESGITTIGDSSFSGYQNLINVKLSESVHTLQQFAFSGCSSLINIEFPTTMNIIRMSAFAGCTSLEKIELPSGLTTLSGGLFSNCTNLTSLTLPDTIQEIKENVFYGCTSLKAINIPKGLTKINKDYTFNGSNLEIIYIPCDCGFEFDASEYVVNYNGLETTFLSDTNVQIIESHDFGEWETIAGRKQRTCDCGYTETITIAQDDDNFIKGDKAGGNGGVGFGTVLLVIVVIWLLAFGTIWIVRKGRRNYH